MAVCGRGYVDKRCSWPIRDLSSRIAEARDARRQHSVPQAILARKRQLERGKLIFFSDGERCRNCHEINDRRPIAGPDAEEINKKYADAELLQHVLQPSLKIDEPFAAYSVLTNDGRAISGLLVEQNDKEIIAQDTRKET